MKKLFGTIAGALVVACVCVTVSAAYGQTEKEEAEFDKTKCYSTYDSGTTTFTKCRDCTETTGSNLTDKLSCTP
ncbi:hypothetical protein VRU48_12865 [Pedobacter sp. KR3-3]|uniref:Uncharacterized protein n=1 Tax=Pedobacter albus TaxID=3113905 RepID=A0ABU7I959_9SPHI|nr:hypothetical protein [Pedobacter sp. KR3-3]MEE1946005.1 hypothetical protein [Pedobacter sp. KR3-3]